MCGKSNPFCTVCCALLTRVLCVFVCVCQIREAKFREKQQIELAALLKRIDGRRREHLKQRELDSKR